MCKLSKDWTCCFSCPYADCVSDKVTAREREMSSRLDEVAYRERGEKGPVSSARSKRYQEHKEDAKAYYQANKEKARAYYQANKEKLNSASLRRYYTKVRNTSKDG